MGEEGTVSIPDHQVGVVWPAGRSDGLIISLNLAGDLSYLTEGTLKIQRQTRLLRQKILHQILLSLLNHFKKSCFGKSSKVTEYLILYFERLWPKKRLVMDVCLCF